MEWNIFINKEGSSNKYWQYRFVDNYTIEKQWGRIGSTPSSQIKKFNSNMAAHSYIAREIDKKLHKGYVESTGDSLNKEEHIASALGIRWKIDEVHFLAEPYVNHKTKLQISNNYDKSCGLYVKLVESWNDDIAGIILSPDMDIKCNATTIDGVLHINNMAHCDYKFSRNVRNAVKHLINTVNETIKKFAVVGTRAISVNGIDTQPLSNTDKSEIAKITGAGHQAISKFASIGSRTIDI